MKLVTVSIGGLEVSAERDATIITHGLGSCIAVLTYDPIAKVAGMLHFQLPTSTLSPERARETPGTFADTGIPLLFEKMYALGSRKADIIVKAAGGGNFHNDNGTFDIGRRNHAAIRKVLWKLGLLLESEHIGGTAPRTIFLRVADGSFKIKSNGEEIAA